MENKRIVVFGATGAVGTYATMDLCSCGYKVIAVGHRSGDNGFFAQYGIPYYSVDIVNKNDFDKLPNNDIWAVVNLAELCLPV